MMCTSQPALHCVRINQQANSIPHSSRRNRLKRVRAIGGLVQLHSWGKWVGGPLRYIRRIIKSSGPDLIRPRTSFVHSFKVPAKSLMSRCRLKRGADFCNSRIHKPPRPKEPRRRGRNPTTFVQNLYIGNRSIAVIAG